MVLTKIALFKTDRTRVYVATTRCRGQYQDLSPSLAVSVHDKHRPQ